MPSAYDVQYLEAALSDLERIPTAKVRRQVARRIEAVKEDPHPPHSCKLQGRKYDGSPIFRVRSGDYRVFYTVGPGPVITILLIGDRRDVYRKR